MPTSNKRELLEDRNLVHALLESTTDHIYFKDLNGAFTRINKALACLFGLKDASEAMGRSDADFFTEPHASEARRDEWLIIKTGEPLVNREEKETWPDGRVTWVSTTKMPLRDVQGKIVGIFGISRDITYRKQAEEDRRRAEAAERDSMERADRLKTISLLAAGVAHEVNNPLQGMLSHLAMVRQRLEPGDALQKNLSMVEQGIASIASLVQKMLSLGGVHDEDRGQPARCAEAIDFVVHLSESQLKRAGIRIEVAHDVPDKRLAISGRELIQVILNLIINAKDAMPDGGTLSIQSVSDGESVMITVCDTGRGVDPEEMTQIFTPFYTSKGAKGSGLGLTVADSLIRACGGKMGVHSELGRGSCFTLQIPYEKGVS